MPFGRGAEPVANDVRWSRSVRGEVRFCDGLGTVEVACAVVHSGRGEAGRKERESMERSLWARHGQVARAGRVKNSRFVGIIHRCESSTSCNRPAPDGITRGVVRSTRHGRC